MKPAFAFLVLISLTAPARAQMQDNRDRQLSCDNSYGDRSRARVCDIRDTTLGPSSKLQIKPGRNGSTIVKGWSQNTVLVRARLEAWADNDSDARALQSQLRIDTGGGEIRGTGPETNGFLRGDEDRYWAVSFEIFTPWNTDLEIDSHNGSITISDIRGRLDLASHNGSVRLTRVTGNITGITHNGSIQVELVGNTADLQQMDVSTHNGSVTLSVPASFSARLETRTNRGRLDSDFPISVQGRIDRGDMNFNIGSGGPLIRVGTNNGGIRLRRM